MNADEHAERGGRYFDERDFDGAITEYTEAIKLDPDYRSAYYTRGLLYKKKKEFDLAIADFTEAIRIDPNEGEFYCSRGEARVFKGDNVLAISDLEMAVKLDPQSERYRNVLATVKLDPSDAQAAMYLNAGMEYFDMGNYDQAIADSTAVIQIRPNDASTLAGAYGTRGVAYLGKKNYSFAITDLEMAVKLAPNNTIYSEVLKEIEARPEIKAMKLKLVTENYSAELRQKQESRRKQTRVIRCIIGGIIGVFLGLVSMGFSSGPYDRESIIFEIIGVFLAFVCIVSGVIIGKTAESAGKGARMGAIIFAIIFLIATLLGNPRAFISLTGAGAAMGAIGGAIIGALGGRIIGSGK